MSDPTPLSPTARSMVLMMWLAPALRAAVDQVVPDPPMLVPGGRSYEAAWSATVQSGIRAKLLAIATELDPTTTRAEHAPTMGATVARQHRTAPMPSTDTITSAADAERAAKLEAHAQALRQLITAEEHVTYGRLLDRLDDLIEDLLDDLIEDLTDAG